MRCPEAGASGASGATGAVRCTGAAGAAGAAGALAILLTVVGLQADRFGDIEITPIIHSSVQIEHAGKVIHVDPWSLGDYSRAKPADLILITDDVGHHLDVKAIAKLRKPGAPVVIAANGRTRVPDGIVLANGEKTTAAGFTIEAIAAYDIKPGEPYHPKGEANGYVITVGGHRLYFAGVTECVPEITALTKIDVAFFPMNVPLERMEPAMAIECLRAFKPKVVYPYHYDQDWVTTVGRREPRPTPTTRGLQELKAALADTGIDVRFANWYPVTGPIGTHTELGLQGSAKVLCSAVFVSGRDPDEFAKNSGFWFMPADEAEKVTYTVDRERKAVTTSFGQVTRSARFHGDQGCIIDRPGKTLEFTPTAVTTTLPDASSQDWPMGDRLPANPLPAEIDAAKLTAAIDTAFADPLARTAGMVVVHKGRLIAERYMSGITKDTQLESWSMGKSITSTLFALLVKDGTYTLEQRAPVPEWQQPDDPRGAIRNIDLLRMSSGLRFIATQDPDYSPDKGYPDHFYIYTGAVNAFDYSVNVPLQFPVNTEGRYRNSDPLTIGRLIKQAVTKRGENYLTWPQRTLFDKIGIRRQVLETDPFGNFLLTGYDYGTPRNWARLGLLYLQDGMWQGTRLLPEGWAKFVSTPAPAWKTPTYGGLFWINGTGQWTLPRDAYFMAGAGGQWTFVIPSHQLVVVRMGHYRGAGAGQRALNAAFKLLLEAIPATN
jgi:CubicO group peptidase (beta-lactamase class C family)/L-ascorbate metabolism protein UlaG (beta-lactamase superfamily)